MSVCFFLKRTCFSYRNKFTQIYVCATTLIVHEQLSIKNFFYGFQTEILSLILPL